MLLTGIITLFYTIRATPITRKVLSRVLPVLTHKVLLTIMIFIRTVTIISFWINTVVSVIYLTPGVKKSGYMENRLLIKSKIFTNK